MRGRFSSSRLIKKDTARIRHRDRRQIYWPPDMKGAWMQVLVLTGLVVVGVLAGASVIMQQILVANLRGALGSAGWAVLISYVGGTLTMAMVLLVTREPMISAAGIAKSSWLSWAGGVFGVIYIVLAILLIPRLGAATVVAALVAGQLLASILFDHFGLFGLPHQPADIYRIAGALMLLGGVVLIRA
jgi:transporter family-2 protein